MAGSAPTGERDPLRLDHRGQGLLGHPVRLDEAGKIAAFAKFRDAQLDRSARVSQSRSR